MYFGIKKRSIFTLGRRGQGASESGAQAAVLVALIGLFIVLYILNIPPEARRELLAKGTITDAPGPAGVAGPDGLGVSNLLLSETPGRVDYTDQEIVEHSLGSLSLFSASEAEVLKEVAELRIRKAVFEEKFDTIYFEVDDPEQAKNALLNFFVEEGRGILTVKHNGNVIFSKEIVGTVEPIKLTDLAKENSIEFSVSSPGIAFWKSHEYVLNRVLVTADVKDISRQQSRALFVVNQEEKAIGRLSRLRFTPECRVNAVGKLTVLLNGELLFSGIPDCGTVNVKEFLPGRFVVGENVLTFEASEGAYLLDQITLVTFLDEPREVVYYFNLDEGLFGVASGFAAGEGNIAEPGCGIVDGFCPGACSDDEDADCCFLANRNNLWCDVETDELDDRCMGRVQGAVLCDRCPSGYEDEQNRPAESCKTRCGDDSDGKCPSGCSKFLDKDCCFAESKKNYWCDDVPTQGLSSACEQEISYGECDDCPQGYNSIQLGAPSCDAVFVERAVSGVDVAFPPSLVFGGGDVVLVSKFADYSVKQVEFLINGRPVRFEGRETEFVRSIRELAQPGTNAIKIVPRGSVTIRSIEVKLVS